MIQVTKMKPISFFCSSGFSQESKIKTESGHEIDMQALSPFLRTLMVMDGTVTKSLSAWFWEPVNVNPIFNQLEILKHQVEGLDLCIGDEVIKREVALVGEKTKQIFAYARSTVALKHLPLKTGKALATGKIGIGELLREQGIETYREIYRIDYLDKNAISNDLLLNKIEGNIISRSYRIRVNGIPSILVTEYFPIDVY